MERGLFVRWVLLNSLFVVALVALAATYGGRIHGASLAAIPAILGTYAYATALSGILCWKAHSSWPGDPAGARLLHEAHWLAFWAWACQILGILSTVLGFWLLLSAGSNADLGTRIQQGGGVALTGTFVGILASFALTMQQRLIEHDLGG